MKLNKDEIGRRYGRALFELATEQDQQVEILEELDAIQAVYEQIPDLGDILTDTRLSSLKKQKLLVVIKQNASTLMQNFLQLLFEYHRLDAFTEIRRFYQDLYNQATGVYQATVTTAIELSDRQQTALKNAIGRQFAAKKVILTIHLDPQIIGGLIVQVGDQIIDGSVNSRLKRMSQLLLNS